MRLNGWDKMLKRKKPVVVEEVALPACPVEWVFIMQSILSWAKTLSPYKGERWLENSTDFANNHTLDTDTGAKAVLS